MAGSVIDKPRRALPVLPDVGKPKMAKAFGRNPDIAEWGPKIGHAIQVAVLCVWDSNKLAAADLGVDDAEFGKWMSGTRRAHFDLLFAHDELRWPLIQSLAKLDEHVVVIHEIRREE